MILSVRIPLYTFLTLFFLALPISAEVYDIPPEELDPARNLPVVDDESPSPQPVWIWYDYFRNDQTVLFRRTFDLDAAPESGEVRLAADRLKEVWINGERAASIEPTYGGEWECMLGVDLSGRLRKGRNSLCVVAQNDRDPAGLLAVIDLGGRRIVSDNEWKVSEHAAEKWASTEFDDGEWPHARPLRRSSRDPMGVPVLYPAKPSGAAHLRQAVLPAERIALRNGAVDNATGLLQCGGRAAVFHPPSEGQSNSSVIVDFGREMTGGVMVAVRGSHAGQFHVQVGESYSEVTHKAANSHSRYEWTQTFSPGTRVRLGRTAYRFVKIELIKGDGPVEVDAVESAYVYYPVRQRGEFQCSDPLLNQIWASGAYTLRACMQEEIWDGPKRDRLGWMGDLYVENIVNHYTFFDDALFLETMDRLYNDTPAGIHINKIPSYTLMWPSALYEHYIHHGGVETLRQRHDEVVDLLVWMEDAFDEDGLYSDANPGWCFVDWGNLTLPESQRCTHMYAYKAYRDGAALCAAVGDKVNQDRFNEFADRLKRAANAIWLDGSTGTYGPSKHINGRAIWSGVTEGERARAITEKVLLPDNADHWATPYGNHFYLDALVKTDFREEALKFIRDYWGSMLEQGATTLWEAWDPRWVTQPGGITGPGPHNKDDVHLKLNTFQYRGYMMSLCHGWSAGPTAWMSREILGVRPALPGYREAVFAPRLFNLAHASGRIPAPMGDIEVELRKDANRQASILRVPKGIRRIHVTLDAPQDAGIEARSNGQKMRVSWERKDGMAAAIVPAKAEIAFVVTGRN